MKPEKLSVPITSGEFEREDGNRFATPLTAAPHVSDYYTPLYDNARGGPPRAFRCEVATPTIKSLTCVRVTRTESGMFMHLRICHGIERQSRLFPK